jgi:hypothetical protein
MNNEIEFCEPPVADLIEEFKYKIKPTETHKELLKAIELYYKENEKFMTKHNMLAGRRARKALLTAWQLIRARRMEISAYTNPNGSAHQDD